MHADLMIESGNVPSRLLRQTGIGPQCGIPELARDRQCQTLSLPAGRRLSVLWRLSPNEAAFEGPAEPPLFPWALPDAVAVPGVAPPAGAAG